MQCKLCSVSRLALRYIVGLARYSTVSSLTIAYHHQHKHLNRAPCLMVIIKA